METRTSQERAYVRDIIKQVNTADGINNRDNSTLIIDRRYWGRGNKHGANSLLRTNRENEVKMCCLGFHCVQAGMRPQSLIDLTSPATAVAERKRVPARIRPLLEQRSDELNGEFHNNALTNALMHVNDAGIKTLISNLNRFIKVEQYLYLQSERQRESLLKKLFATVGITVEFVN